MASRPDLLIITVTDVCQVENFLESTVFLICIVIYFVGRPLFTRHQELSLTILKSSNEAMKF
jgi:hypothetical protein